jgi:hypothetical protein
VTTVRVPQLAGLEGEAEILAIAEAAASLVDGKRSAHGLIGLSLALLAIIADGPPDGLADGVAVELTAIVASYIAFFTAERDKGSQQTDGRTH